MIERVGFRFHGNVGAIDGRRRTRTHARTVTRTDGVERNYVSSTAFWGDFIRCQTENHCLQSAEQGARLKDLMKRTNGRFGMANNLLPGKEGRRDAVGSGRGRRSDKVE